MTVGFKQSEVIVIKNESLAVIFGKLVRESVPVIVTVHIVPMSDMSDVEPIVKVYAIELFTSQEGGVVDADYPLC